MAALKDKSPRVRASASLALGNIGADDENVVALLAKALKDKSLDVRYAATLALSRIGTPAARKAYKARLGEDARRAIEQP
jgi:HEAT repeat protein